MKTHFELNSSSLESCWLHDALQSMSIEQLDFFFRCVHEIIWHDYDEQNREWKTFGYGNAQIRYQYDNIVNDIRFHANRIEQKFYFSFDCRNEIFAHRCYELFEDVKLAIMYLAAGKTKEDFVNAYEKDPSVYWYSCDNKDKLKASGSALFDWFSEGFHDSSIKSKFNGWRKKLWKT